MLEVVVLILVLEVLFLVLLVLLTSFTLEYDKLFVTTWLLKVFVLDGILWFTWSSGLTGVAGGTGDDELLCGCGCGYEAVVCLADDKIKFLR